MFSTGTHACPTSIKYSPAIRGQGLSGRTSRVRSFLYCFKTSFMLADTSKNIGDDRKAMVVIGIRAVM